MIFFGQARSNFFIEEVSCLRGDNFLRLAF